ncbi:hypothetical protein [Phaffia rhodozyma]|uniref:Uncharacterized protein n=1 Tax=Phaffia rhodozyma TaxID=264483 RepID=A0A0F7SKE3_PHARH|nr:hypothetical protein [Phaffia rhodozyma]
MNQDEARKGARQRLARRLLVKGVSSPSDSPSDSQNNRGARRASVVIVDENRSRKSTDLEGIDRTFKDLCTPERKSAEGRLERERVQVGELVVVLTPPEETRQPSSTLFPSVSGPSPTFSFRPRKRSTLRSSFTRSDSSFSVSSRTRTSGSDSSRSIQRSASYHQQHQTGHQADDEDADYNFPADDARDDLWNASPTPFSTPSQELPSNPFGFDSTWVHTSDEAPRLENLEPALNVSGVEVALHSQTEIHSDEGHEQQQVRSQFVTTPPPDAPLPTLPTSAISTDVGCSPEASLSGKKSEKFEFASADKLTMPASIPEEDGPNHETSVESPEKPSSSVQILDDSSSLVDTNLMENDVCIISIENSDLSPPKMKDDKKEKGSMGKTLKTFRSFTKLLKLVGSDGKKNTVARQDAPAHPIQASSTSSDHTIPLEGDLPVTDPGAHALSCASDHELLPPVMSRLSRSDSIDFVEDDNDPNQTPIKKSVVRKLSLASLSNVLRSSNRKKSLESMRGTRSSFSSDVPKSSLIEKVPAVPPIPTWVRPSEGVDSPGKSSSSQVQTQPSSQHPTSTSTTTPIQNMTTTETSAPTSVSYEHQALERPSFAVEAACWALAMVYTETPSACPTKATFPDINIQDKVEIELEQNEKNEVGKDVDNTDQQLFESNRARAELDEESELSLKQEGAQDTEREREISIDTANSTPDIDTDTDTDTGDEGFFDAEEGELDQDVNEIGNGQEEERSEDDPSHVIIEVLRAHSGSSVSASVSTVSSVSSALSTTSRSTSLSTPSPTPYITDTIIFSSLSESIRNSSEAHVTASGLKNLETGEKAGDKSIAENGALSHAEKWGVRFESLNFEDLELDLSF